MTAPIVAGAAIALPLGLVWFLQRPPAPSLERDGSASPPAGEPERTRGPPPVAVSAPAERPPPPTSTAPAASTPPSPERSPLPGEAPATPMTQLLEDRQQNIIVRNAPGEIGIPPQLADGERAFAAEPIDAAWAPGAEARLLAVFAAIPGLELIDLQVECRTTMCRLQLTQPPPDPAQSASLPFNLLRDEVGMTPRWMMTLGGGPPGAPPGPLRSIAYLWREGFAPDQGAPQ
jgi:hypothetical protein